MQGMSRTADSLHAAGGSWAWNFPPIADPPKRLGRQLAYVLCEATAAEYAFIDGEPDGRIAEELMDTIHEAETALRMLGVDMDEARRAVIEKNAARGFYGKEGGL